MATWTTIPNADVAVGAALDTALMTALRDNPQAIAEGASGAPKIQNAAFDDDTIGSEKLQSGSAEDTWVRNRIAGGSNGQIGTYAFLAESATGSVNYNAGRTQSGSNLNYGTIVSSSGSLTLQTGASLSGTWKLMGDGAALGGAVTGTYVSVWLRIS